MAKILIFNLSIHITTIYHVISHYIESRILMFKHCQYVLSLRIKLKYHVAKVYKCFVKKL